MSKTKQCENCGGVLNITDPYCIKCRNKFDKRNRKLFSFSLSLFLAALFAGILAYLINHAQLNFEGFFINISYYLCCGSLPGMVIGIFLLIVGSKRCQRKILKDSQVEHSKKLIKTGLIILIISVVLVIYFIIMFNLA